MTKKIFLFVIIFFLATKSYSQWQSLNPRPSYIDSKKVKFLNEQIGFIINGTELLQTIDNGVSWNVKQLMPLANDMKFVNGIGYIACDNGTIYKSADVGETWTSIQTGSNTNFHTISIVNENTVLVASENSVMITTNGGSSWATMMIPFETVFHISAICFTSAQIGSIGTNNGSLYKTTDGGITWDLKTSTNTGPNDYVTIYFVNENLGFASHKSATLMRTSNGGDTWTEVPDNQLELFTDIQFISDAIGYACGEANTVYKTSNGGLSWTRLNTPDYLNENSHLYGIYTIGTNIYTVGTNGRIYKSSNGGASFIRYSPTYNEIKTVTFADATTAYALSVIGDIYKSTDSGNTWQFASTLHNSFNVVKNLEFVDANTGYTIMGSGLHKTTDGGLTWTYNSLLTESIITMEFINPDIGFISGGSSNPVTKKTIDGGLTWQTVANQRFGKIQFLDANVGYAKSIGFSTNKIYKTIDGGITWTEKYSVNQEIRDFDFVDENTGYFAGNPGVQRKTTDGGNTWQPMPNLYSMYSTVIRFADANTGYALDDYGLIYKTIDGGDIWTYDSSLGLKINDLIYHGENVVVVGSGGRILSKSSGVVLTLPETIAENDTFTLYPNPAKDSFTISAGNNIIVSIQLFDLSGRMLIPSDIILNNSKAIVKMTAVTPGIYMTNILLANGRKLSKKIIIKQ
jgi:photosystem II stability/assembly factor-like uncharacterized protein